MAQARCKVSYFWSTWLDLNALPTVKVIIVNEEWKVLKSIRVY